MNKVSFLMYGTLRKNQPRNALLPTDQGIMETVFVNGFKMYALPWGFPGVTPGDKNDTFIAELWTFTLSKEDEEELIHTLDEIEGTEEGLYTRILHTLENGRTGYLYICAKDLITSKSIRIEDWNEYIDGKSRTKRNNKGHIIHT